MTRRVLRKFIQLCNGVLIALLYYFCSFGSVSLSFPVFFAVNTHVELSIKSKVKIFKNVKVNSGSKLITRKNSHLVLGKSTSFNFNCIIVCRKEIIIGENCQFGPGVIIYDHDHNYKSKEKITNDYLCSSVVIGDNVWIGANTIILRGTKIGSGSVIAAGSVVKNDIPENCVVYQKRESNITTIERIEK